VVHATKEEEEVGTNALLPPITSSKPQRFHSSVS